MKRRCLFGLLILAAAGTVLAQSRGAATIPPGSNLQNPGARALALGGAVIGLADDASASELNPAGITQIPRNEISVEYRQHRIAIDNRYADSSAFQFSPSAPPLADGNGECLYAAGSGLRCGSIDSSWGRGLAFASAVIHTPYGLSLALYRHEIDRESLSFVRNSLDIRDPANPNNIIQIPGTVTQFDRQIDRVGLALGYKLGQNFGLGFSVNENSLSYSFTSIDEYQVDATTDKTFIESGNQKKFGYTAGLLYAPTPTFQIGAAYSSRVRFQVNDTTLLCLDQDCPGPSLPGYGVGGGPGLFPNYVFVRGLVDFVLPEKYGIGIAFRPPRFNIVAEADRVLYSDNDRSLLGVQQFILDSSGNIVDTQFRRQELKASDITELHFGIEWLPFVSPAGSAFAIRAGYFHEPDHLLRPGACTVYLESQGASSGTACPADVTASFFAASTSAKHTANHVAGGIGIIWTWGQIDIGYDRDTSLHQDTLSTTLVIRP